MFLRCYTKAEKELNFNGITGKSVNPHPDGQPWDKCCESSLDNDHECQCAMRKPAKAEARIARFFTDTFPSALATQQLRRECGRFFCIHRKTDDGYHRECAGWYAKYGRHRRSFLQRLFSLGPLTK